MKKTLKSIQKKYRMLNEGYAWERTPGKALPTLEDVQNNYNEKSVNEQQVNISILKNELKQTIRGYRDARLLLKLSMDNINNDNLGNAQNSEIIAALNKAKELFYDAAAALEVIAPGEG